MPPKLATVNFHGQVLKTFKDSKGKVWLTARHVADALELNWSSQHARLTLQKERFGCSHFIANGRDGNLYETVCIPLNKLNDWLSSITPEKRNRKATQGLTLFREECVEALCEFWEGHKTGHSQLPLFNEDELTFAEMLPHYSLNEAWQILSNFCKFTSRKRFLRYIRRSSIIWCKTERGWVVERRSFNDWINRLSMRNSFSQPRAA